MFLVCTPSLRPLPVPAAFARRFRILQSIHRRREPLLIRLSSECSEPNRTLASRGTDSVLVSESSPPPLTVDLGLRRDPVLGFFSIVFVLSLAVSSFFSLAIIFLPALNDFRRLSVSADKLSKVVSEEVPGTLAALKLSGLEIDDLTYQLNILKQRITGKQQERKQTNPRSQGRRGISYCLDCPFVWYDN
ncbi:uncharacterized protein LOC141844615 isoform X2 [Curcuma longa]|uniref:uncharacterized protein LOC141844615 isoform X2 n=1 Tax=Curcuma longa TaxID=136217 RepID=UPI003D9F0E1D